MCPLQTTNAEIRRRLSQEQRQREQRRRADLPVRSIDALLAELEELHLEGRKRVPETFDDRLDRLVAALPADCRLELRSRITIVHLMDRLYAIQDRLLARRTGARAGEPPVPAAEADDDDFLPRAS